jgi:hypothetical protein
MLAFGSNNIHNYSPRQDEAAASQGMSVTYANVSGNMVTVSGYMNNRLTIIYRRDVVGPGAIDTELSRRPESKMGRRRHADRTVIPARKPRYRALTPCGGKF